MKYKKALIINCLIMFLIISISFCYAERVKVIEGMIEDVTDQSIKVRGHSYNISDTPIKNASDETLSKASLKRVGWLSCFLKTIN